MFRNRLNISYLIKTMCSIRGTSFCIIFCLSATYETRQIGRIFPGLIQLLQQFCQFFAQTRFAIDLGGGDFISRDEDGSREGLEVVKGNGAG